MACTQRTDGVAIETQMLALRPSVAHVLQESFFKSIYMNKAVKLLSMAFLGILLATNPVRAQDSARSTTTTTTSNDTPNREDDHGKWGLAGLLGLLGLLGLRKKEDHHHVDIQKRPNT
ncbi:MAG: hypothetical protein NVS1B13_21730 [Flavisolibacter sp.]